MSRLTPPRRSAIHRVARAALWVAVGSVAGVAVAAHDNRVSLGPSPSLAEMSKVASITISVSLTVAILGASYWSWARAKRARRDHWWRRTEWALAWAALPPSDARSSAGQAAITYQLRSSDAAREDLELLRSMIDRPIREENASPAAPLAASGRGTRTGDS